MSATAFPPRQAPAAGRTHTACGESEPEPEATSDDGYPIKVIAAVLLVTAVVAILAPFGWAVVPVALAILLATTAAVLHATVRLLNETGEGDR
jgi:hypothetical protein